MAEGGALQAGGLWGQGLCLQLKGVTKGACSQAIKGLDSNPEEEEEEDDMTPESWKGSVKHCSDNQRTFMPLILHFLYKFTKS